MSDKIVKASSQKADRIPSEGGGIEVGQWYWVKDDGHDGEAWLGCVVHVGSNYAELNGAGQVHWTRRVHFDVFDETCERERDADSHIKGRIAHYRDEVGRLMGQVRELTARLGVAPGPELPVPRSETKALAVVGQGRDMDEYRTALTKAKDETLPDLFEKIKEANEQMGGWMTAGLIPLKAQAAGMKGAISKIEDRIFNVQLYAGLVEEVVQVSDGEAAPLDAKVHLFQRRHYMDEECLAAYRAGGMDFGGVRAFDRWLERPENRDRILPFSRCVVAFQVRRNAKEREAADLSDFIRLREMEAADRKTFLYIRNGGRLYRMGTEIEFGEKLFPDLERSRLGGHKLWADTGWGSVRDVITDDEYRGIKEEHGRRDKEYRAKMRAYEAALRTPEAKARARERGKKKPDSSCVDVPWPGHGPNDGCDRYTPFNRDNVMYDDILAKIEGDIRQHNRVVLILQGLLDRSPVLHPHPPWQLWTDEGFRQALEPVYDGSRALPAGGGRPDFEAYRAKLNASLRAGCVTVGQEDAWERREAEKEGRRLDNDWRVRSNYRPTRFRPYGDPGPGRLARVVRYRAGARTCTFAWTRERRGWGGSRDFVHATVTLPVGVLLNVDAYRPGDFRQFFDDPRTRAEYLEWAPLLLEAEEYHAGNREVKDPPERPRSKGSLEGKARYRRRKRKKALLGKAVRLTRRIVTRGGDAYEKGSLWKACEGTAGKLDVVGITDDGKYELDRTVFGLDSDDLEADPGVLVSEDG